METIVTKKELASAVAQACDMTQKNALEAVQTVFAVMEQTLEKEGTVDIYGFGKFTVAQRAARTGYNPRTQEPVQIAASKAVKFKASSALKKLVNGE